MNSSHRITKFVHYEVVLLLFYFLEDLLDYHLLVGDSALLEDFWLLDLRALFARPLPDLFTRDYKNIFVIL